MELMPPPTVNGMLMRSGNLLHQSGESGAPLSRCTDVEIHQLIGTVGSIVRPQLHGVANVG